MADRMFKFENKYHSTASVSSTPANTVLGNQPVFIPTNGIRADAIRYTCKTRCSQAVVGRDTRKCID